MKIKSPFISYVPLCIILNLVLQFFGYFWLQMNGPDSFIYFLINDGLVYWIPIQLYLSARQYGILTCSLLFTHDILSNDIGREEITLF